MRNVFNALKPVCARVLAVAIAFASTSVAKAQSAPPAPAPPPGVINLGDLGVGDTLISANIPILNGQNIWFRFRLTQGITKASWLNIDSARSVTDSGNAMDTEIGMYNEWAYRVGSDNFSGGGKSLTSSLASAMTFGGGSGMRLGEDGSGWVGGRIDTGWNQDGDTFPGGWRPYLGPGIYYICVVGYNADFSQLYNPNWQVSTSFQGSGVIRLRIRAAEVPSTRWNETHNGYDAGYMPGIAQVVEGKGSLSTILCAHNPGETDVFKIRICDPGSFRVDATPTLQWGDIYGARLYLLNASGRGILGINSTAAGIDTSLTVPSTMSLEAGDYYLVVSSNCGGIDGYQAVPYDLQGEALWDFANSANWNKCIAPNGTGKANPMFRPGRQSDCINNSTLYSVRLNLSGACYVESSCPADFDGTGFVDSDDFTAFITAFEAGC
jgi:hypothetical protein